MLQVKAEARKAAADLLATMGADHLKNANALSKGLSKDAKFNKWLASGGELRVAVLTKTKEEIELLLGTIGGNFTSIESKRAALISLIDAKTEEIVAAKDADVTGKGTKNALVLSPEQKAQHEKTLAAYATNWKKQGIRALAQLGFALGVVETVAEGAAAPVMEPAAAN